MINLSELAIKFGSDKHGHHYYCQHYEKHFLPFKDKECVFLELGIGGYHFPDRGGAGLKMWREWFTKASVTGIDIFDKSGINWPQQNKLNIYQGSQNDTEFLRSLIETIGRPNIIVDDASHNNKLTIQSFRILFDQLAPGGIYAIEDIESSWWQNDEFEGCEDHQDMKANTAINLIREIMNDVCYKSIPHYQRKYPIASIHLYENLVFIHKEQD